MRKIPLHHRPLLRAIRAREAALAPLTDAQLRAELATLRQTLRNMDDKPHIPPHALATTFAAVSLAAQRTLHLHPYDVQLLAAIELSRGRIAEMATGEGKTLAATLPATLLAITPGGTREGVHIVTVNDYLAQRDADTMGPVYRLLGLSVGIITSTLTDDQRRAAYQCDIVYATNKELGFDFLRDQIKRHDQSQPAPLGLATLLNLHQNAAPVMRSLHYALIDEADSILIDEARTPLIIAAPSGPSKLTWAYQWAHQLAAHFRPRHHFDLKTDKRIIEWNDAGLSHLQSVLATNNTPSVSGTNWQHLVINALRARWLFEREQHYVIANNDIVIVDEFTGRRMPGRTWADGLHQAIQAKEHLPILEPAETLARTTYQHFFSRYTLLAGMTGTATTERAEFKKVFNLHVIPIPTHRPIQRTLLPDIITRTTKHKWQAVLDEIRKIHGCHGSAQFAEPCSANGAPAIDAVVPGAPLRPILIGTHSIEDSESLSRLLHQHHIPHLVLNAKPENAPHEADIVAAAGQPGAITIATNMAGRGTDISLDPSIIPLGGLHIIATQRHESRRVDRQLIGRCARQGDPGTARFILSLQDPILRHTLDRRHLARVRRAKDLRSNDPVRLAHLFRRAQLKIEALHYRMRRQLVEYEDWLNEVYHQMGT